MFKIWEIDETNIDKFDEQVGSKAKFWFKHPELGLCLFKKSREDTGEHWAEKITAELAKLVLLPAAKIEFAKCTNQNTESYGIISESFIPKDDDGNDKADLRLGNELLFNVLENYPRNQRKPSDYTLDLLSSVFLKEQTFLQIFIYQSSNCGLFL